MGSPNPLQHLGASGIVALKWVGDIMTNWQQTPFVDDWTNKAEQERYRQHAREVYERMKDLRADSRRYHVEYGKWLIASLLALHGGSIYVISTLAEKGEAFAAAGLIELATWNMAGIVSILVAGCMAWLNFQFAEIHYDHWSDPSMLYRQDKWPGSTESKYDPMTATLFLAAAAGVISIWCFIASASQMRLLLLSQ